MVVSRSTFLLLLLLTCILATSRGQKSLVRKKYTPDWESLDARPLPKWYDDVKIGIFVVWGPYSVPGLFTIKFETLSSHLKLELLTLKNIHNFLFTVKEVSVSSAL